MKDYVSFEIVQKEYLIKNCMGSSINNTNAGEYV